MDQPDDISVILPELFASFLAVEPRVNPAYESVRRESESAIIEFCSYDHRVTTVVRKGDFCRFVAIAAPDAEESRFKTYCDWCNWVFPFDDLFDNGQLKVDAAAAQEKMQALFASMDPTSPTTVADECDLIRFHFAIWSEIRRRSSLRDWNRIRHDKGLRDRWHRVHCNRISVL